MAESKKYVTAVGFVQFEPNEREVNGKDIVDILIKTPGGDGKNIRVTVWPELLLSEPIRKGDFVAVDGSFSTSPYQDSSGVKQPGLQISAYTLNVNGKRIEREPAPVVTADQTDAAVDEDTF